MIKKSFRIILGLFFIFAGVAHFRNTGFFLKMMPPFLPYPEALVYISGVFEIVLGTLVIIPKTSRLAAIGIMALLIAVYPANFFMCFNPELFPEISPTALLIRLPIQFLLLGWAWVYTKREKKSN